MNTLKQAIFQLREAAAQEKMNSARFFKTNEGDYSDHDHFLGVSVPTVRLIAKGCIALSFTELQTLLESKFNEERLLALLVLIQRYKNADAAAKKQVYDFYLHNIRHVNNWNLVDASAHEIVGAHLFAGDRSILLALAASDNLWERRIAIVTTWHFIRNNDFEWTLTIAKLLLTDSHDLIHKATGWMLREMGKKDQHALITFLDKHAAIMPRTMLRYAIEKFPAEVRKNYLSHKKTAETREQQLKS